MPDVIFRDVKKEIRILGVDDSPFDKFKDKKTALIGVVFRGGIYLEGVLKKEVEVDGDDATSGIIEMVKSTRHRGHLRVLMLSGITFGGLNIVDIENLNRETALPVIIVTRRLPDLSAMKKAISRVKNPDDYPDGGASRIKNAGSAYTSAGYKYHLDYPNYHPRSFGNPQISLASNFGHQYAIITT